MLCYGNGPPLIISPFQHFTQTKKTDGHVYQNILMKTNGTIGTFTTTMSAKCSFSSNFKNICIILKGAKWSVLRYKSGKTKPLATTIHQQRREYPVINSTAGCYRKQQVKISQIAIGGKTGLLLTFNVEYK